VRFECVGEKILALIFLLLKKWIPAPSTHSTTLPAPNDDRSLFGTGHAGQALLRTDFAGMTSQTFKPDAIIVAFTKARDYNNRKQPIQSGKIFANLI